MTLEVPRRFETKIHSPPVEPLHVETFLPGTEITCEIDLPAGLCCQETRQSQDSGRKANVVFEFRHFGRVEGMRAMPAYRGVRPWPETMLAHILAVDIDSRKPDNTQISVRTILPQDRFFIDGEEVIPQEVVPSSRRAVDGKLDVVDITHAGERLVSVEKVDCLKISFPPLDPAQPVFVAEMAAAIEIRTSPR